MDKYGLTKKNMKLSETDRKVLLTYLNTPIEQMMKPKNEIISTKKNIKL